jgi:phosphoglycolate phosphatase/putative hydrolase of the HAD superfamily
MRIFDLPSKIDAVLFDMDSTLYTHKEYAQSQTDLPVKKLAGLQGRSFTDMSNTIMDFRKKWAAEHQGQNLSLANIFLSFGVSVEKSVRWREELYEPEKYLGPDIRLQESLKTLSNSFILAVVTNNPVSIARRTLLRLGVENLFKAVVGLDTCGVSKPHRAPFLKAAELCGAVPAACVSVGDRYDIDIALPRALGMGGVLVDGVRDVYKLPDFLK